MIPELESVKLNQLNRQRRVIGVLVKWCHAFYTNIEEFHAPADTALIGVFGSCLKDHVDAATLAKFDVVLWYEVSEDEGGNFVKVPSKMLKMFSKEMKTKSLETNSFALKGVESALEGIAAIVDNEKLRLIIWEEHLVFSAANIGLSLGIPGPTNTDLDVLRNKKAMKEFAVANGIPTAPFLVLPDFPHSPEGRRQAQMLVEKILSYPLFVKPIYGVGSAGSARLQDSGELLDWLEAESENDTKISYLFETCIEGAMEFWADFLITKNGTELTSVDYMPLLGMFDSLNRGKFAWCTAAPQTADRLMPGIVRFVQMVAEKYAPPPPAHFTVQGFFLKDGSFLLTELAYRMPGPPFNIGFSHEIPHLMAVLDDEYTLKRDDRAVESQMASVWFATVPGTLKSKELRCLDGVKSRTKVTWFVDVGFEMKQATSLGHMAAAIHLFNNDKDECLTDMNSLFANQMLDIAVCA